MSAWQSAFDEFNETTLPWLKSKGHKVGEDADSGNEAARNIIKHYTALYRSFDPLTFIQLKEAINTYSAP